MPSDNGYDPTQRSISYHRVREVARKLEAFTPSQFADALDTTYERAEEFIGALTWQGLLLPEVEWLDYGDGGPPEPIYTMEPMPDTIYNREKRAPPEITAIIELYGGFLLYDLRGVPVRLSNKGEKGRVMSTPGARQKQKLRDLAWERQQSAIRRRIEMERRRRIAISQGKKLFAEEVLDAQSGDGGGKRKTKKAGRVTK